MGWVWRALIAALLLGGTVAIVPGVETYASGGLTADGSDVLHPALNDDCPNSNPRKQKKCHYNNQDNINQDNVSSIASTADAAVAGAPTIAFWTSAEKPVWNVGFQISVTGSGGPIAYVEFWADPPASGPPADDIAGIGKQHQECGGAQPCTLAAPVVARFNGWYVLHAVVVDTSGRAASTDWMFLASENARN
jgi:hypothetical protein